MTDIEKVHFLCDKYEDKTEGMFQNTLWQLLVNEVRRGVQSAFVYIYVPSKKNGVNVGIADMDVSGYTPCTFSIKKDVPEKEREDMLEELNREVFGITDEQAWKITASSMRS